MFLSPETELGPFEIVRLLGVGGMAEVYFARDRQLNRSVALKVLRADVAGPHRHARFEQEAHAASALNHPNICHTYRRGETPDGRPYIAMEYVEGETLDQRLVEPLALREALDIAIQIASALTAAHSAGIVHRDIKPGNVIVRRDRLVKVLDFGLAKHVPSTTAFGRYGPTHSTPETEPGSLVGTPDYMSPEQARGHDVDARTDIWALGVVLYEMLAHRHPFAGSTRADVLVSVLGHEPAPLTDLKPHVPTELQRIVRKALRKDPEQRYQGMKDLLLDLEALRDEVAAIDHGQTLPRIVEKRNAHNAEKPAGTNGRTSARWRRAALWMIAAAFGVGAVLVLGYSARWKSTPTLAAQRLSVELGTDGRLPATDVPLALSSDGTLLAFVARPSGKTPQLYVRRLDQLTATPLSGTEGASTPCFSPDGQWLAFFADLKLKKVPATGGAVVTLAEAPYARGAWWAEDDTIVFAPHYRKGLMRVSSGGGQAEPVTTLTQGDITHRFPQVLPGGAAILYTASTEVIIGTGSTLVVQPLPSGERTIVQRGGYFGRYVASGHIVYMQDDTLFAMPFDIRRLAATGPAARTIDGIKSDVSRGSAQLTLSRTGTMAYIPGRNTFDARPIAWMDRTGTLAALRAEPADWYNAEFSPDGRRIAMEIRGAGHSDIWVYDWPRGTLTRVTSETTNEESPVWTPDGARLVYRSFRSSTDPSGNTISWKRADGTGDAKVLIHSKAALSPGSWHPRKKLLSYVATMPGTGDDVMILPVEDDEAGGWKAGKPTAFVNSAARERAPTFSPDGRWLSYTSNESGQDEVYVRPFPGPGARVMVSSAGGHTSSWSRARPEIVFTAHGVDYMQVLMVARYRVEKESFVVDKPRPWAERPTTVRTLLGSRMYALHPDGARVAIAPPSAGETVGPTHLTFVFNLFDEFRRIAPAKP
jgi:serine/threonine protein kinase/WD40 repeat protein